MARLKRGEDAIYFFHYDDPVTYKYLKEWDRRPLVYPLWVDSTHLLAINLHWVPMFHRLRFVAWLQKVQKETSNRKFPRVVYNEIKRNPKLRKSIQGVRKYILKNIKNVQIVTDQEIQKRMLLKPNYRAMKSPGGAR